MRRALLPHRRTRVAVGLVGLLVVMLATLLARPANAQGAPARPEIEVLRYEEDWRVLCDRTRRTEPLDALKCLAIAPNATLTLGGEFRERFEIVDEPDFGLEKREDSVLLHRAMVHADLRVGGAVRAFVQLGAFDYTGRQSEREPFDLNRLDLVQGFLDLSAPAGAGRATLRGGRQEISLGSSRLAGVREGPNVRRAFDGGRAFWAGEGRRVDAFYLRPVIISPGVFDDATDDEEAFWGVHATGPVTGPLRADLYYLGYRRGEGRFASGAARERRHSLGVRLFGGSAGFDWDWEAVYQFGHFGNDRIRAWTVATDTGFTIEGAPFRPRFGLKADIASGDHNPADGRLGTFNALYPKLPYFSEANLVAPANIMDLHPTVELAPARGLSVEFGWNLLWRESRRDAVYGTPLTLIEGTAGASGRFIGYQAIAGLEWQATRNLTLSSQYVHFQRGEVVRAAGGRNVDFFFASAAYKF